MIHGVRRQRVWVGRDTPGAALASSSKARAPRLGKGPASRAHTRSAFLRRSASPWAGLAVPDGGSAPGTKSPLEGLYAHARAATPLPALSLSAKGARTRSRPSGEGRHCSSQQGPARRPGGRTDTGGGSPSSSSSKSSTKNSRNGGRFGRLRVLTSCWIFADTRLLTGTPGRQKHRQTKGRDGQHLTRGPSGRDAVAGALS